MGNRERKRPEFMTHELIALCVTTIILIFMGLAAIISIVVLRPSENNTQIISTIATLLGPSILLFIQTFKTIQNSSDLKDLKVVTNGNIQHQVKQAAAVATLTEQVNSAKTAAQVAAKTAADTASALNAKIDSNTVIIKEPEM